MPDRLPRPPLKGHIAEHVEQGLSRVRLMTLPQLHDHFMKAKAIGEQLRVLLNQRPLLLMQLTDALAELVAVDLAKREAPPVRCVMSAHRSPQRPGS